MIVSVVGVPVRIEATIVRLSGAHVASCTGDAAFVGNGDVKPESVVVTDPCISEMPVTVTVADVVVVIIAETQICA